MSASMKVEGGGGSHSSVVKIQAKMVSVLRGGYTSKIIFWNFRVLTNKHYALGLGPNPKN